MRGSVARGWLCPYAAKGDFSGLVDIGGGRTMYLECHGNGSPTVVLVSGAKAHTMIGPMWLTPVVNRSQIKWVCGVPQGWEVHPGVCL